MLHFRSLTFSILVVAVCCISSTCFAQFETLKGNFGVPLREKSYVDIEGNPYLYNRWSSGSVTLAEGKVLEATRVKYNIYEDELDMIYNNSPIAVHKKEVKAFTIQESTEDGKSKTHTFHRVELNGEMVYMEALYEGNVIFYKHHKRSIEAPQNNTYSAGAYNTKRFISSEKYYLKTENGLQEMRPKVNSLSKLLPEQKSKIKSLSKTGTGDYNSENGIAMLLSMLENDY